MLIPQSIAYATIVGLPPQAGLFAASIPLIVAAPFVSCPWLQTGPVALTSILTYGALSAYKLETTEEMMGAAALVALIVGVTRFLLGAFRLGGFTKLLSRPVVLGFTTAAAILIICSQLSKALGATNAEPNVLYRSFVSLCDPSIWNDREIFIALIAGSVAWYSRKVHKLFPSILVAVVVAIFVSKFLPHPVETVGNLPGEFISLNVNLPLDKIGMLLLPGLIIAFVGFAEPASISMTLMEEANREWSPNWELCGGGMANIASALVGGYPVGGSFSRTSINRFAGSTTSWSGFFTGCIVLSLLCATPVLKALPISALAAVIIVAVLRLLKFREIWEMAKDNWLHGAVAIFTLFVILWSTPRVDLGVLVGVTVGTCVKLWEKLGTNSSTGNNTKAPQSNQ